MTGITLYGGVREIGGNKILLEDSGTRIFLDFGEPFRLKDRYFIDFLKPRDRFGLRDYFHFDLLPKIPALYDKKWLENTDFKHADPEFDAIFISHMHFDHAMHLKFADSDIPVYMGVAANTIRKSWMETSAGTADFGNHDFREFRTGRHIKVGGLEVEPVHVDHSTPGAYGFLVHTRAGCVAYTGDLRMHGPRSDMTREFVERAAKEEPVALICEGTRVSEKDAREDITEDGVRNRARDLISANDKMAIVSFYPRDVDRMRTFRDVAELTGRRFVVSAKVANLLEHLGNDKHIDVPDPMNDPSMLVYSRQMKSYSKCRYEGRYREQVGSSDHVVDSEYVSSHQSELIFHTDFFQLTELVDISPEPGSLFIRSKSEPFEEEDEYEEILRNWIEFFRLDFQQAHASGHASMQEVFSIIDEISPGLVIPIHTEAPQLFERCGRPLKCPEPRQSINIERS